MSAARNETVVAADHAGQRLDNFLIRELDGVPRSLVYRLIRTGQVRVNGSRARPMRKLAAGDRVRIPPVRAAGDREVTIPESRVAQVRGCIIHRQDEFVVVDKPAGMAVQAGTGLSWGLNDIMRQIEPRAVPVHRLDRETSGVMLFALGAANARQLQRLFHQQQIEKRYLALLDGQLREDRVDVDLALKKVRDASGEARVVVADDGKPASSTFRRLERIGQCDFVEVTIATGRTHQIRVHAAALGAPLVGDARYNPRPNAFADSRLFLHAASLRLPWPDDQVFSAPLPQTLQHILNSARQGDFRS